MHIQEIHKQKVDDIIISNIDSYISIYFISEVKGQAISLFFIKYAFYSQNMKNYTKYTIESGSLELFHKTYT